MGHQRDGRHHHKGLVNVTVWVPAEKAEAVKRYASRVGHRRAPVVRDDIMALLREHQAQLDRFGVAGLSLFGSVVRDEARHDSDVDLLVEFDPARPTGLFQFVDLKRMLEGLLGRPVDLITATNIKPRIKARILGEAVRVF